MSYDPHLTDAVLFDRPNLIFHREPSAMTFDTWTRRLAGLAPDALPTWEPDLLEPSVPLGDPEQEADARDWLEREFEPIAVEDAEGRLVLLVRERRRAIWTLPYLWPGLWERLMWWWEDWREEVWVAVLAVLVVTLAAWWRQGR